LPAGSVLSKSVAASVLEQFLYRGVHAGHPALAQAKQGICVPGNEFGQISAAEHNLGGVSDLSPFTSWTIHLETAERWALLKGPGGVILVASAGAPTEGATWSWEGSPDVYFEREILMRGTRVGLGVRQL